MGRITDSKLKGGESCEEDLPPAAPLRNADQQEGGAVNGVRREVFYDDRSLRVYSRMPSIPLIPGDELADYKYV